jgi:hypothetical protein
LGGKEALLTALQYYSAVRSHQTIGTAGSPLLEGFLPESGRRDPSPMQTPSRCLCLLYQYRG